jgi:beta-lactamase class A
MHNSFLVICLVVASVLAYKAGDVVCTEDSVNIRTAPCGDVEGPAVLNGIKLPVIGGPMYQCCFGGCYNWTQVTYNGKQGWMADKYLLSCKSLSEVCKYSKLSNIYKMINFVASLSPIRTPGTDVSITVRNFRTGERASYRGNQKIVSASSAKAMWVSAALIKVGIGPVQPYAGPIFKNSDNDATGKVIDLIGPDAINPFYFGAFGMNNSGFCHWNYGKTRIASNCPHGLGDDNYFTSDDAVNFLERVEARKILPGKEGDALREWLTWSPRTGYGGWLGTLLPAQAQQTMQHKAGWIPPAGEPNNELYRICNEIGYVTANGARYAISILSAHGNDYWNKQVPYLQYVSCMIYYAITGEIKQCQ